MELKTHFLKKLHDSKYKEYYLQSQIEIFQTLNCRFNSAIALISASSIVAWILMVDYFYIWALLLIFTQGINILKPTFPFRTFLKECKRKLKIIQNLNIEMDLLSLTIKSKNPPGNVSKEQYLRLKKEIDAIAVFEDKTPFKFKKRSDDAVNKKMKHILNG
jgi:hypothetical protein